MAQKFANAARSALAANITNVATSLTVDIALADLFPVADTDTDPIPTVGKDYFKAVLQNTSGDIEIVYVRTRALGSPTFSNVIRGQEGTTAIAFLAGSIVGLRHTAEDLADAIDLAAGATVAGKAMLNAATVAAQILIAGGVPSGTRAPFAQAAAPTGWTQDTTDAATNRMLRVVNTAGGGIAGSDSPILNNVVVSHTHTFTTGVESASHTHTINDPTHQHPSAADVAYAATVAAPGAQGFANIGYNTGFAATGITLNGPTVTHTHSGTTAVPAGAANWAPRYIDMIICSRN